MNENIEEVAPVVAETNVAEETLANTVDNNAPVAAEEAPLTDAEGNVVEDETVAEEVTAPEGQVAEGEQTASEEAETVA